MANVKIFTNQGGTGMFIERQARLTLTGKTVDGVGGVIDATDGTIYGLPVGPTGPTGAAATGPTGPTGATGPTAVIAPGSITRTQLAMFTAQGITGTGAPIATPHTLGVDPTPANVFFTITKYDAFSNPEFVGLATDASDITVQVEAGIVYSIIAFAP